MPLTKYPSVPKPKLARCLQAAKLIVRFFPKNPLAIVRSLNVFRYRAPALSLSLLYQIIPFLESKPYDIVHCQFGVLGLEGVQIKQILGGHIKLVTSFRGYDATKVLQRNPSIYQELFETGDLFLPVSHSLKDQIVIHGGPFEKTHVLPSGIDTKKISFSKKEEDEQKPITLITVARLVEKKGIQYAIEAAARLLKRKSNFTYVIIGEGPLRSSLERLIEKLEVSEHVQLLGRKTHEEVIKFLQEAHILIAPSMTTIEGDQEGIPNVLKEAMALGLPVISTYHGGIPELIRDGETGLLVKEKDVDAMAEKLSCLIDHPEERKKIGQAGRAYVQENFDIQNLNDRLVHLYRQLIKR